VTGKKNLSNRRRLRRHISVIARTLPRGFNVPAHSHNTARLIYAATGTLKIETPDGAYIVPPTRALLVPMQTEHSVKAVVTVEQRSLDLAETSFDRLSSTCRVIGVTPLLREIILRLAEIGPDYQPDSHASRIAALVREEIAQAPVLPLALPLPRDQRLRRLCDLLLNNPTDTRPLAELGEAVGASTRTLTRLFKSEISMSFVKWRQQARMMSALAFLAEGCSVTETALMVGYESVSAFIRLHRRLLGMTPRGLPSEKKGVGIYFSRQNKASPHL